MKIYLLGTGHRAGVWRGNWSCGGLCQPVGPFFSSCSPRQAQPQPPAPSKPTELEMASQFARNPEAPPPSSQEEVSYFFPCKQHFLDLQVKECKGGVNRVTRLLKLASPVVR